MKRLSIITTLALMAVLAAQGKTTYIPTYTSYIHIVADGDTISADSNLTELELSDRDGMFTITLLHEEVDKAKVKAIKRAKRAAGWMEFSAAMSGVSTVFSTNRLEYAVRSANTAVTGELADIYRANANAVQTLKIEMQVENTSQEELMVCDMERGLTWWVLPNQTMTLTLHNPEATRLRISDAQSRRVRYASALAGSKTKKYEIDLETDDYWYSPVYKPNEPQDSFSLLHYIRISKTDYSKQKISKEEYREAKKAYKGK